MVDLFSGVFARTIDELEKAGRIPSDDLTRRRILSELQSQGLQAELDQAMLDAGISAAGHGRATAIGSIRQAGLLVGTPGAFSKQTSDLIRTHVFEASQHTLDRVAGVTMDNLTESYEQGLGIDESLENLKSVFQGMKDWELRRVARTEINSFQSEGAYQTMQELGVDYQQWWGAQDSRVRSGADGTADHVSLHGQIVKVGERFSNGLLYPGDRSGGESTIEEWVNCRCRAVPFIMPAGYQLPMGQAYFYEADLIQKE